MDTFGYRLAKSREKKNLSQSELATKVGIGKSTLSMYEIGKREPNFETTKRIAAVLGVSAAYLMGETDDPAPLDEKPLTKEHIQGLLHKNQITMFMPGFDWESFDKLSPEEQQIMLRNFNEQIKVVLQIKEQGNK